MEQEVWKDVRGYEGLYEVSSRGRVRSLHNDSSRILSPIRNPRGYLYCRLSRHATIARKAIHHLVLEAFRGPRPKGYEAAHWNGDPSDNRPANLRWATHAENCGDQVRHGTTQKGSRHWLCKHPEKRPSGERNGRAVLTEEQVRFIKRSYARVRGQVAHLARTLHLPYSTVMNVVRGHRWGHVKVGV